MLICSPKLPRAAWRKRSDFCLSLSAARRKRTSSCETLSETCCGVSASAISAAFLVKIFKLSPLNCSKSRDHLSTSVSLSDERISSFYWRQVQQNIVLIFWKKVWVFLGINDCTNKLHLFFIVRNTTEFGVRHAVQNLRKLKRGTVKTVPF